MNILKYILRTTFIAIFALLFLTGCDFYGNNHPYLKKGEILEENGNYDEAVLWYKKYLSARPKENEIHLKIALIYDEQLGNYLNAIYHYKEYLTKNPNASNNDLVTSWLKLAEENYLKSKNIEVPKTPKIEKTIEIAETPKPTQPPTPVKKEAKVVEKATPKVVEAPTKKVVTQEEKIEKPQVAKEVKETTPVEENTLPKVHIVKRGDTLSHISVKYYGTIKHYKKIIQYNNLSSPNDLKIGQRLLIPNLKEFK